MVSVTKSVKSLEIILEQRAIQKFSFVKEFKNEFETI